MMLLVVIDYTTSISTVARVDARLAEQPARARTERRLSSAASERAARRRRGRRRGGVDVDAEADVGDVAAGGELPDAEAVAASDGAAVLEAGAELLEVAAEAKTAGGRELQEHAAALADERHRAAEQDGDDRERGERVGERASDAPFDGRVLDAPEAIAPTEPRASPSRWR